jgi:hypothetical protein
MRRSFMGQQPEPDERGARSGDLAPKNKKPLSTLKAFGVVVSVFAGLAAIGLAGFLAVAWLAWSSHSFSPRDLRYLVFVRGTLIERVGAIDAQPGTLMYTGQGRDGNAPGYARARYTSLAPADVVYAHLIERCRLLGLQIREKAREASEGESSASCGRGADDEYHVHFSVRSGRPTEVLMGADIDDGVYASR